MSIIPPPVLTVAAEPADGKSSEIPEGVGLPQGGEIPQGVDLRMIDGMAVHRVSEEHLRVWMAPFQDGQGNLHEGSVIHTVLKPGYWQLQSHASEEASE